MGSCPRSHGELLADLPHPSISFHSSSILSDMSFIHSLIHSAALSEHGCGYKEMRMTCPR